MSPASLVPCMLGAIAGESALYGTYLVMFMACVYAMFFKRRSRTQRMVTRPKFNRTIIAASVILFLSISSHWLVDVARLFNAFWYKFEDPGALLYFANLSDPLQVAKTGMIVFQLIVGDFIFVYRLWIIWNRSRLICIFPLCTLSGLTVTSIAITYQFSTLKTGVNVFVSECGRWITSCCVLSLATNLFCSAMISYRIWSVNRDMKVVGRSSFDVTSVIAIVVESAAIYTAWLFAFMVTYLAKSNIQYPVLDMLSPVVGISFSLIIIRVSLGLGHRGIQTSQATSIPNNNCFLQLNRPVSASFLCSQHSFVMKSISVNVQRDVVHDFVGTRSDDDIANMKVEEESPGEGEAIAQEV